jgi:hypothetical protein
VNKNDSGESKIIFDVVMSKEIPLEKKVYDAITGLMILAKTTLLNLVKNDDLLFMKQNGQLVAALKYLGNNTFAGGEGYPKAIFELQKDGTVRVAVTTEIPIATTYHGSRYLKYN